MSTAVSPERIKAAMDAHRTASEVGRLSDDLDAAHDYIARLESTIESLNRSLNPDEEAVREQIEQSLERGTGRVVVEFEAGQFLPECTTVRGHVWALIDSDHDLRLATYEWRF